MAKPMGMMSGCYFVGRGELIEWVNELLGLHYEKVEDVSNGAAFCQIIDAIHPGTVALGHVKFDADLPPDIVNNYKILQDSFNKNSIQQYIDVATLTKGKYMAALEMFQWIHGYYQQTGPHGEYDPVARRKKYKCNEPTGVARAGAPQAVKPAGMARRLKPVAGHNPAPARVAETKVPIGGIPGAPSVKVQKTYSEPEKAEAGRNMVKSAEEVETAGKLGKDSKPSKETKAKISELEDDLHQMNQERDFYYGKLRKIEEYCQQNENDGTVKKILEILYEADAENGFVSPGDEEEDI